MTKFVQPMLPGFIKQSAVLDAYLAGTPLQSICDQFGLPHIKRLYQLIPRDVRRIRTVRPETREEIIHHARGSVRSLAKQYGFSKTTIHRLRTSGDDAYRDEEIEEELEVVYQSIVWRCPDHGKMSVSPCPICAARGVVRRSADDGLVASSTTRKMTVLS
jgi:hypothetical protein